MSLMGVDIGTTGVKAVVFDGEGHLLRMAYREYPLLYPSPGFVELDSSQVLKSALSVIAQAAGEVRKYDPVRAIGVSSQGEAFTPVASDGKCLGNGMVSSDRRAADMVEPWTQKLGKDFLYQTTGHTPYVMYSLFKLAWLKTHRPDIWEKAWKFLFYEDLLIFTLTGRAVTDFSLASRSMLFDIHQQTWSSAILKSLELPAEKLPEPVPSGTAVGTVRSSLAKNLSLDSGTIVATGGHDQPCGALGCGATGINTGSYAIGTVECVCPTFKQKTLDRNLMAGNLATYPHVLAGHYTTVAFNVTGGSSLRWVRDQVARQEVHQAQVEGRDPYEVIIEAADDQPSRVLFLPHLAATGTPHFDPYGTGLLFGLQLNTTRGQIIRAILEGITYEMKWNLSLLADVGIRYTELRAVGGGAKSSRWMQIKADLLGVPIGVTTETEAAGKGAALLAGAALGALEPCAAGQCWSRVERYFEPQSEWKNFYDDQFALYCELYRCLGGVREKWHRREE